MLRSAVGIAHVLRLVFVMGYATYYIPVRHDMMRQTNDCSPVRVMQHKVKFFRSAPSTFPNKRSTHRGPFPGVPSH